MEGKLPEFMDPESGKDKTGEMTEERAKQLGEHYNLRGESWTVGIPQ